MLLDRLRERTRDLHAALEQQSAMAVLTRPDLTEAAYAALLARLYAFYAPLDAALARFSAALGIPPVDRAGRIARDLAALGAAVPEPPPEPPFGPSTDAEALGALYVVEGAALGGNVLAKHIGRTLGLTSEHGLAFFSSDGANAGPRWKAFVGVLEASEASPDAVVDGAVRTFNAFAQCLN